MCVCMGGVCVDVCEVCLHWCVSVRMCVSYECFSLYFFLCESECEVLCMCV